MKRIEINTAFAAWIDQLAGRLATLNGESFEASHDALLDSALRRGLRAVEAEVQVRERDAAARKAAE